MKQTFSSRLRTGASLIELLVVIVIFLVGVLAVVQIFPRGIGILRNTRGNSIATQLAKAELERLKGLSDQIPDAILANNDGPSATGYFTQIDMAAMPDAFMPSGTTALKQDGTLVSPFANGDWKFYAGANRFRAVLGEGRVVPTPRFVRLQGTDYYGGLLNLAFAPVRTVLPATGRDTFLVYGGDLSKRLVDDDFGGFRYQDYTLLVDFENNKLYVPQSVNRARQFRISMTYYDAAGLPQSGVASVPVPQGAGRPAFYEIDATVLFVGLATMDYDSIRAQRQFLKVTPANLTDASANPALRDDAAYEYTEVNTTLGMLLFNPAGFDYQERRGRNRLPLVAKVDYNVFDWRVIRDDFRVPGNLPFEQKLVIDSLKVLGELDLDGRLYKGLEFDFLTVPTDHMLIDTELGAIVNPDSYQLDKSLGVFTFRDVDNNANNGLTANLTLPDGSALQIADIRGRAVRALYRAKGDWSVQPFKAVTVYNSTRNAANLTYDQCFAAGADNAADPNPTFVYFPLADIGKSVIFGEVWYRDALNNLKVLRDQDFLIRPPVAGGRQLGHIDVRDKTNAANITLDFSNGFCVRRIRGVTMSVRVMWNASFFKLTNDEPQNLLELEKWLQGLRKTDTESFITRSSTGQ